ncbi:MAG TPA: monofunctional biosynthetic peptidoglycan transglycosylase [Gammaproteobacteria bacterium]|nr:monofunctional biosynthetic peptidoglycan transglycosylase [Gammaproteobacteria bacterium]
MKWIVLTSLVLILLVPAVLILSLRWIDPLTSMFMLERQYELWQANSKANVQYEWVDAEKISPKMMLAVVAAEDQKFPLHFGFDLEAIEKAMAHNRRNKKIRGASTITQQVAKNLFLRPSRSWLRKGMEVYITALIELFWSKQRIVEVYVNIAQFDDNVFGVGAASQHFFRKPAAKLTVGETALLAAVLPSPKRYHVENPTPFVMKRANWIQQQMYGLGDDYIVTGVVPVRQYQAVTAASAGAIITLDEEPIDELLDEMEEEELSAAVSELADTTQKTLDVPDESSATEVMPATDDESGILPPTESVTTLPE